MNSYWKYVKYILNHKCNIMRAYHINKKYIEPRNKKLKFKLFWRCVFHDMSKFYPDEFIPYMNKWICHKDDVYTTALYNYAVKKHYRRNKHHIEYWECHDMDELSVLELVCDWTAMSFKSNNIPQEYYYKNRNTLRISNNTRIIIERYLGFKQAIVSDNSYMTWDTYCKKYNLSPDKEFEKLFGVELYGKYKKGG